MFTIQLVGNYLQVSVVTSLTNVPSININGEQVCLCLAKHGHY